TGRIPRELGALTKLETLSLGGNALTGEGCNILMTPIESIFSIFVDSVPPTRWQDRFSRFNGGGYILFSPAYFLFPLRLTGTIPLELGKLTALQTLLLHRNQLSGDPVPNPLGDLNNLEKLQLD
ncbi:unnamed protein product, partial [Scytosiphon promiscuus]